MKEQIFQRCAQILATYRLASDFIFAVLHCFRIYQFQGEGERIRPPRPANTTWNAEIVATVCELHCEERLHQWRFVFFWKWIRPAESFLLVVFVREVLGSEMTVDDKVWMIELIRGMRIDHTMLLLYPKFVFRAVVPCGVLFSHEIFQNHSCGPSRTSRPLGDYSDCQHCQS